MHEIPTLSQALDRYGCEATPLKKGAHQERKRIRKWKASAFAHRPLDTITRRELAEWRSDRQAEGRAPSTVRNDFYLLAALYKHAASEWGLEGLRNPVEGLRMPRHRPARDRRAAPGELAEIVIAPETEADYDRTRDYGSGWRDDDGDCQDARQEVLVAEALAPVALTSNGCRVTAGVWFDPFTGELFTTPFHMDIDHLVPLKEAHDSGPMLGSGRSGSFTPTI